MIDPGVVEFIDALRNKISQLFLVGGNVYDTVLLPNKQTFPDLIATLAQLTADKFPNFFCYDIFRGLEKVRGSSEAERKLQGAPEAKEQSATSRGRASGIDAGLQAMLAEAAQSRPAPPKEESVMTPLVAFRRFDNHLRTSTERTVIVIRFPEQIMPVGRGRETLDERQATLLAALATWSQDPQVFTRGHLLLFVGTNADELAVHLPQPSQARIIRLRKPSEEACCHLATQNGFTGETARSIARTARGLSYKTLEKILERSKRDSEEALIRRIFAEKRRIIRDEYSDLLELVEPKLGFEVIAGLDKLVRHFKNMAANIRRGKTSLVPQGVLLMGPPGTGKTLFAEALAKDAGINFVRPRDIKSMWVGESERRMSRFIAALYELAPVIVFIDEFDQNQGQRGSFDGDSGVSRGLFKKMLEVMTDTSQRGLILWMLATNRPDLIDPALKRSGRCDQRIPLLLPDVTRREEICQRSFQQFPDMWTTVKDWRLYAERMENYGGSDVVEVVRSAWVHANEEGRETIIPADMEWACSNFRPQLANRREVIQMSLLALREASSKEFLPPDCERLKAELQRALAAGPDNGVPTSDSASNGSRMSLLEAN